MKYPLIMLMLLFSLNALSQSNFIFSVPQEYNIHVEIGTFSYTKPKTWQLKFTGIAEGLQPITITVTKPNTNYKIIFHSKLQVDNGYETTYFVIPKENTLQVEIAVSYNLKELYGNNNVQTTSADGRYTTYQNKPVFSVADIKDLKKRAIDISFDNQILDFLRSTIKKGWLYSEDVAMLLGAFSFDNNRLSFAKFAYDYTVDKHKYYTLSNSFDFSSNYNDLMNYIKNR